MNFHPEGLDIEIEAAMWRNLVEPETFKFSFIEQIHPDVALRYSNKDYYSKDSQEFKMQTYRQTLSLLKKSIVKRRNSVEKIDIYN